MQSYQTFMPEGIAERSNNSDDFQSILKEWGMEFYIEGPYYRVGMQITTKWIIDISVVPQQFVAVLYKIIPILKEHEMAFQIPISSHVIDNLYAGGYGYLQMGKVISIFPCTDHKADLIAKALIANTKDIRGAAVPTDYWLGNAVYVRYGSDLNIPFSYPTGVTWPFNFIKKPSRKRKGSVVLKKRYVILGTIKADIKGNVYKALVIHRWLPLKIGSCLIKEGKRDTSYDREGRTIKDRLILQYRLEQRLRKEVNIPKVYDLFDVNGDTFLVTEFVEGINIQVYLKQIFRERSWQSLSVEEMQNLLSLLRKVLSIIVKLHANNFIHRDITPVNFMIGPDGAIYLIDLELCYHPELFNGRPPFTYGTPGFMSEEQLRGGIPEIGEDIFAIGAMMICFFTGLSPYQFQHESDIALSTHLNFFIQDHLITDLIVRCLNVSPSRRPSLAEIDMIVSCFQASLAGTGKMKEEGVIPFEQSDIFALLQLQIQGLATPDLSDRRQLWFSKPAYQQLSVLNHSQEKEILIGWYSGISGVLFVLSQMKHAGIPVVALEDRIRINQNYLLKHVKDNFKSIAPGLYGGTYGLALTIAECMACGWIANESFPTGLLQDLVSIVSNELSVANGLAGLGITLLSWPDTIHIDGLDFMLKHCVKTIITQQQKDGSWISYLEQQHKLKLRITGYSHGCAGIICFLIRFYQKYPSPEVREVIEKGLGWLMEVAVRDRNAINWYTQDKTKENEPWLDNGSLGIALTFINAYRCFEVAEYRVVAEGALANYSRQTISGRTSFANGLAGLGYVYLKAARIFDNKELLERARYTGNVLKHTSRSNKSKNGVNWLTVDSNFPTADFMTGNTGIGYFLLQFLNTNHQPFF